MPDNPFVMIQRLLVASGRITAYVLVFMIQATAYALLLQKEKIVDAFGYLGRGIADALAGMFKDP